MYIKSENPHLRYLYDEELMGDHYEPPGIEFSEDKRVANVVEEVGTALVESDDYPLIKEKE